MVVLDDTIMLRVTWPKRNQRNGENELNTNRRKGKNRFGFWGQVNSVVKIIISNRLYPNGSFISGDYEHYENVLINHYSVNLASLPFSGFANVGISAKYR